jgi:hypothetical protein
MTLINTILKFAQGYIAFKICIILFLIHQYPKTHSINDVLWWICVLILDLWLNLIVFKTESINLTIKEKDEVEE